MQNARSVQSKQKNYDPSAKYKYQAVRSDCTVRFSFRALLIKNHVCRHDSWTCIIIVNANVRRAYDNWSARRQPVASINSSSRIE